MKRRPELLIRDARVVDGLGRPAYSASVAVSEGRIISIGPEVAAERVIDAQGRVLTPGFIDMHTHSDLALLERPVLEMKLAQGVTLEVLGQDGLSCAPVLDGALDLVEELISALNGESLQPWSWRSVAQYLSRLNGRTAQNVAYLVPHGTVRALVLGSEEREATPCETARMEEIVTKAMHEGAFGLSTGLSYPPAHASSTDEIVSLAAAAARVGGIYVTHLRSYGPELFEATEEALEIGRRAGVPVHFSHFQAPGRANQGRMAELIRLVEAGASEGLDVSYDVYPYEAASTMLTAFVPAPIRYLRRREAVEALGSDSFRHDFVARLNQTPPTGMDVGWADLRVANGLRAIGEAGGDGSLVDLAARRGETVGETVVRLLELTECRASVVIASTLETEVDTCLVHALATVGSDGILVGERPHPRGFGTFPRFLRRATRGGLTLEEAIAAMTGRAAARLGLSDRGSVSLGAAADLCIFDPDAFEDEATYENPTRLSRGMDYVVVNGELVWVEGKATGAQPGQALKSATSSSRDVPVSA